MAVTILETLMDAEKNLVLKTDGPALMVGWAQLHNAVVLLTKGYALDELVEPLLEKYDGDVDSIPDLPQDVEGTSVAPMVRVITRKAQDVGAGVAPVPNLRIEATEPVADYGEHVHEWERHCRGEGRRVASALAQTLPGGVFDEMLSQMLMQKASRLRSRLVSGDETWELHAEGDASGIGAEKEEGARDG